MIRSVIAVIAGWVTFGLPAALLFQISGHAPHDPPTRAFVIGSTIYGIVFAIAGGVVSSRLAPRAPIVHAAIVSLIIAAGALGSMLSQPGVSAWSQTVALVAMAPAAIVGGFLATRRTAR
jgi:hypothetical protein